VLQSEIDPWHNASSTALRIGHFFFSGFGPKASSTLNESFCRRLFHLPKSGFDSGDIIEADQNIFVFRRAPSAARRGACFI